MPARCAIMISPFGVLVALVGIAIQFVDVRWVIILMIATTPFTAAVALSPPGLSGASVMVPNFFLAFFILRALRKVGPAPMVGAFFLTPAGLFLGCLILYGMFATVFYPRLFAGMTETISLQRSDTGKTILGLTPLAFKGTHITQTLYALVPLHSNFDQFGNDANPKKSTR